MTIPIMRYRPDAEGLGRWFGTLEAEIMEYMWERPNDGATVHDVHRYYIREVCATTAYTTIMTTLARLAEKGVLVRRRVGMPFVYRPACSQGEFERLQYRAILKSIEG